METAHALRPAQADQVLGRKVSMLLAAPLPGEDANGLLNGNIGKERQVEGLRRDGSRFPISLRLTEALHERERSRRHGTGHHVATRRMCAAERGALPSAGRKRPRLRDYLAE